MSRFFKVVGIVVVACVIASVAVLAFLYLTLCTGHPHGMC